MRDEASGADYCSRFLVLLARLHPSGTWQGKAANQPAAFSKTSRKSCVAVLARLSEEEALQRDTLTRSLQQEELTDSRTPGHVGWAGARPSPAGGGAQEGAGPGPPVKPRARTDRNSKRVSC